VERVESFVYLGTVQRSEGQCLSDIKRLLPGLVCDGIFVEDMRLSLLIKIRTYKALVLSTLLYAAETWTVRAEDVKIMGAFTRNVSAIYSASYGKITSVMLKLQTRLVYLQSWITSSQLYFWLHHRDATYCPSPPNSTLSGWLVSISVMETSRSFSETLAGQNPRRQPTLPADVWRDAVRHGHRGATQRPSTTTR